MTLYSGPISLFARKAEIALGEKGLAFERIMVPFTQAQGYQPKHPDVLAANPKAQVPVLIDGDLTMFDSTLIFEYLEEAYPEPALWPKDPKDRARCRMMELFGDEILLPAVRPIMHRSVPPSDAETRRKEEEAGKRGELVLLQHYAALDSRLDTSGFLCGDYSYADIGVFTAVAFSLRLKGPRLDEHPRLAAWYARVEARPAVAKVKADLLAADRLLSPTLYA
ncbi:MAG: glutathione S-transferase family protein [Alphaproteobacteria bacterium]|nr:glutathione S-transferase family protein [Alphaproteobacteria bacterium]